MSWRFRRRPQDGSSAPAPKPPPPPPRLAETQRETPLLIPVKTVQKLTRDQTLAGWKKTADSLYRGDHLLEVVAVVHPDEPNWIEADVALSRLPTDRCATQWHVEGLTEAHARLIHAALPGHARIRVVFLGTRWQDPWGYEWAPCALLSPEGGVQVEFVSLRSASGISGVWMKTDLAAILLTANRP